MKLHLDRGPGQNVFTGYGDGYVSINNQRYEHSVLLAPGREVLKWDASFDELTRADFEALLEFQPEVIVFGTGEKLRFPQPHLTHGLHARSVGVEVMDTKAACRTYNILVAEGRQVVAAVLL